MSLFSLLLLDCLVHEGEAHELELLAVVGRVDDEDLVLCLARVDCYVAAIDARLALTQRQELDVLQEPGLARPDECGEPGHSR